MAYDGSLRNVLFDMENGGGGEEISTDAGAYTEVEPVKVAAGPGRPTDRQIDEHKMTHIPFPLMVQMVRARTRPRPATPSMHNVDDPGHRYGLLLLD